MKATFAGAAALALTATTAMAGGIERGVNNYGLLFEPGDKIEFGATFVRPNVVGKYEAALGGGDTGNMANSYTVLSATYKNQLSEKLDFGIFLNQPYGAGAEYTRGVYSGLTAQWESDEIAAILKYNLTDRISVFGGARYVKSESNIKIPELLIRSSVGNHAQRLGAEAQDLGAQAAAAAQNGDLAAAAELGARAQALGAEAQRLGAAVNPASNPFGDPGLNFSAESGSQGDWGYVVGAAYSIPDIALRVALTYQSAITHNFDADENLGTLGINDTGELEIEMPQSLALDFQTGVAPGTLVFGSVKWTEWSAWEVRTPAYESVTGNRITGIDDDVVTWKLGVGRQFNEKLSGFAQVTYEAPNGREASRLNPVDGNLAFGLGGQWTDGNSKLRAGVQYVSLGEAEDSTGTKFEGNSAIGVGVNFTMNF
ncbi:OmpP1/FadL family transporter [Cognatishimia sp. F0-27]|uniref:OmpP1/FadL family transporter n=1 Tax=Cognatishimia sp. F0-27 TaxID=2816855 RepID=UPI001D0C6C45|nr:outer membrane protein transport protein [Cognatishimia sp. F0-27]MCC1493345.1 outer membrane protein transport protein [Cognatishimia sp. F0-27]